MSVERARALRKKMTPPELALWFRLRELKVRGWHFRRQAPEGAYIADFVCRKAKLVVEVDGVHHADAAQSAHDQTRDAILVRSGFTVLRFWATDVRDELDGVMDRIVEALLAADAPGVERGRVAPGFKGNRHRNLVRLGLRKRDGE
jgi:very-short-patch-repair endonuclease